VKYYLLLPSLEEVGGVLDELQWIALLQSAGAYHMFRKAEQQAIIPRAVARFLLLDPVFPRAVRHCLEQISDTLRAIQRRPVPCPHDLECLRGLTLAKWSYVRIDDLISWGLHEAIDHLQSDLNRLHENRLHELIHKRYFVTSQPGSSTTDPACVLK